jgi:hypothetical protein
MVDAAFQDFSVACVSARQGAGKRILESVGPGMFGRQEISRDGSPHQNSSEARYAPGDRRRGRRRWDPNGREVLRTQESDREEGGRE